MNKIKCYYPPKKGNLWKQLLLNNEEINFEGMEQNKTYIEELAELEKRYKKEKQELSIKHTYLSRKYEVGDNETSVLDIAISNIEYIINNQSLVTERIILRKAIDILNKLKSEQ